MGRYLKTVNKTTQVYWLVRKSSNGGNTWSTVDSFGAWPASGKSLAVDVFGRVFAIGFVSTSTYTWVYAAAPTAARPGPPRNIYAAR